MYAHIINGQYPQFFFFLMSQNTITTTVGTLYREVLREVTIHYDSIYKREAHNIILQYKYLHLCMHQMNNITSKTIFISNKFS